MRRAPLLLICIFSLSLLLLGQRYSAPGKVVNSRHDLSVTSAGATYKAAAPNASPQNQVCVFCHTPHLANPAAPLWNHTVTGYSYTLYSSSTLASTMAQPTATDNTKLCLSCHDGTVALGSTVNNGTIPMANSVTTLPAAAGTTSSPPRNTNLGVTLADDHPVAFTYTPPVLPAYPQVQLPPAGDPVALELVNGVPALQCTGCHNPHEEAVDPTELRFLRKSNSGAAICTTCHLYQGSSGGNNAWNWNSGPSSDHQSHTNTYNTTTNDPGDSDSAFLGSHTSYTTTATNGCEACHRPHTAHNAPRLLKGTGASASGSAQVCFQCHDGNITTNIKNPPANTVVQNIKAAFTGKTYKHPGSTVSGNSGTSDAGHDPAETLPISANRHAACDDCHNPHAAKGYETAGASFPAPPALPSSLWGVRGVKSDGAPRNRTAGNDDALYQYEICFKCHADSTNKPQTSDVTNTGSGYGRLPRRMSDFSGATNCTTPISTRGNTRNEFALNTTSYHPVVKALNHTSTYLSSASAVPSLRPFVKDANGNDITSRPLSASSIIYCTDCHNNDTGRDTASTRTGTAGPAGPHGSNNIHLLERTLSIETAPTTPCSGSGGSSISFNVANYKMCDKCHDITNSIRANQSFSRHSLHTGLASCDTCHDPHSGPGTGPSPALVNFDKSIVGPSNGVLQITNTSLHHGTCQLTCHGQSHNNYSY